MRSKKSKIAIAVFVAVFTTLCVWAYAKQQRQGCGIMHFGPDVTDSTPPEQNHCQVQ